MYNYVPLFRSVIRRPEVVVRVLAGGVAADAGGDAERVTAACYRSCKCCSRSCSTPTPTCRATWSRRRARRTASSRACSAPSVCALTSLCTATASTPLASSSPPRPPGHRHPTVTVSPTLQRLVYDILPSTTAVFSYATGSS